MTHLEISARTIFFQNDRCVGKGGVIKITVHQKLFSQSPILSKNETKTQFRLEKGVRQAEQLKQLLHLSQGDFEVL